MANLRQRDGSNAPVRGIEQKRVVLGSTYPGDNPAHVTDGLRRLGDMGKYMNRDQDRYWLSLQQTVAQIVQAAVTEATLSGGMRDEGFKDRVALRLERAEAAMSRKIARGTGVLATIGATAPFVGLFGTVWGIMNSFIGISEAQTTNLAVVAPGIAEALLATALGLVAAIPAVMISQEDGTSIRDLLDAGPVNATIQNTAHERDGCLDAGVVAHEYGHGISIRLTGGASTSSDTLTQVLQNPVGTLGATLALPFLEYNKTRLAIAGSELDYQIAESEFRKQLYTALVEVEDGLAARHALRASRAGQQATQLGLHGRWPRGESRPTAECRDLGQTFVCGRVRCSGRIGEGSNRAQTRISRGTRGTGVGAGSGGGRWTWHGGAPHGDWGGWRWPGGEANSR